MPPSDPRMRRAYERIAQNIEVANERTQETLYSFSRTYIAPCVTSVQNCIAASSGPLCCCGAYDDDWRRRQRERARLRGRAEFSFDFYDDLEDGEADALLGLGTEVPTLNQPPRERHMNYGTRQAGHRAIGGAAAEEGTKNIPSSSYFGFLDKLPFKIGTKGFKYQPSIADLQEQPAIRHRLREEEEEEPLLAESDNEDDVQSHPKTRRTRRNTHSSRHTTDSLSSRGDIFPSEDEMDDAVPLDIEYALTVERGSTSHGSDDSRSDRKRLLASRISSQRSVDTISSTKSARKLQPQPLDVRNYPSMTNQMGEEGPSRASDTPAQPVTNTSDGAAVLQSMDLSYNQQAPLHTLNTSQLREPSHPALSSAKRDQAHPTSPHSESPGDDDKQSFNAAALPRFQ